MRRVTVGWPFLGRAMSRDWSKVSGDARAEVFAWARSWMICEGSWPVWDGWVAESEGLSWAFVRERLVVELGFGRAKSMGEGRAVYHFSVVCLRGCLCGGGPTRWRSSPVVVEVVDAEV